MNFKLFALVILVTLTGLMIFGCGKQGSRFANIPPTIQITSYEGDSTNVVADSMEATLFQQKIFWHAMDTDGNVAGFAYRVIDSSGNYVSTPGNSFIDLTGEITPQNVIDKYGVGWVIHYKPGADHSVPLDSVTAQRSIWTEKKYALINFKAATVAGISDTTISEFEIICVDNRGEICQRSAIKKFKSWSAKPTCFLSTTKGDPAGGQVGTGIRLSFSIKDDDPFIPETPWFYEFKLVKCNTDDTIISDTETQWYSTIDEAKLNQYLLTKTAYPNRPHLTSDYYADGTQKSYTRVIGRVTDLAGIISDPDTISFAVKEGFHPQTLIYHQRVYALGDNHHISYPDESTPEILPYTVSEGEQRFATSFFLAQDTTYTAVYSQNLKTWLRWGWHGEYGLPQTSGNIIITDNPYDKKVDVLLDADTDANYFSEITHFDIRLDGQPYNYPPLAQSIHEDANGKKWLRVPLNSSLGQTIVLANQRAGVHTFEVRAVDLQDEVDPTPAVFSFTVINPVPKASKEGILVIDDDPHNVNQAPEDSIDVRYENMLSGYSGTKVYVKRHDPARPTDQKNRKFALSDIQRYKFIIYHNDFVTQTSNLPIEHDAFALYLKQGGNMFISGGSNIHGMVQAMTLARQRMLETYFGVDYSTTATNIVTNSLLTSPYFYKAVSQSSAYNSLSLAFDLNTTSAAPVDYMIGGEVILPDPNESSFVSLINSRKGLGPLAYFLSYPNGTAIFKYGCKPYQTSELQPLPSDVSPYYFPPQAAYNNLNARTIGLKRITTNNKCYITSFPLSNMKMADSKQFMTTIINEVMGN